jgi:hypothetical protein
MFGDIQQAARLVEHPQRFQPQMTNSERERRLSSWQVAVRRARTVQAAEVLAAEVLAADALGAEEGSHGS